MPQMHKLSNYATTVATGDDGLTRVTYHSTVIVAFDASRVILNTGGWNTATTRRKMNQASRQFRLGYGVGRDKGESYVSLPDGRIVPLADGVEFAR